MARFDFWSWFDRTVDHAKATDLGRKMTESGYGVAHTGGGCLCWERTSGKCWAWICDEGQGLFGPGIWLVGVYGGDFFGQSEFADVDAALAWCEAALANPQAYLNSGT